MKKILVVGMLLAVVLSAGCGRNAQFGVVDMNKVQTDAPAFKSATEELQTKGKAMQEEMAKEMKGKNQEEAQKIMQEKSAQMQALQKEAQDKLKGIFETAAAGVAKEKNLSAILVKEAVPQGGVDVTDEIIKKMK